MTCERTKQQRVKFLGARPGEIRTPEDRRLVTMHPQLLRDRIEVAPRTWICGRGQPVVECQVHLCDETATHECDGCDLPICRGHATRRGTQWVEAETGFVSPGSTRMAFEDTYDLCPFCLFDGAGQKRSKE